MLDTTKCNQNNSNKFKNEIKSNECALEKRDQIDCLDLIENFDYKNDQAKQNHLANSQVSNLLNVLNAIEDCDKQQIKSTNFIKTNSMKENLNYEINESIIRSNTKELNHSKLSAPNCLKVDKINEINRTDETINVQNRNIKCSNSTQDISFNHDKQKETKFYRIRPSSTSELNNLNNLDNENKLKTCSNQQANKQIENSKTKLNLVQHHRDSSIQSNLHLNLQPTTSHYTHSNENHSVHFAIKNEKQPSISIGHFSIYLDRLDYEYRPSDILTGKLHILLESGELQLRRIVIYLKGISSVKFTEREYQSNSQNEKHFEDVEYWSDHFLMELKTRPRLNGVKVLEPGEYHLPFKFTFPSYGIPSSFESTFGYIRYWIYSEIRSKDKNRDAKEKEKENEDDSNIATSELPVEVYAPCTIPVEELRRPINAEQLKVMGCLGCCTCLFRNPDFIQVRANIMHQGQRKGSSVQVNLFIVNKSRKQIQPYVILKQRNEFKATNKAKINEIELTGCPSNLIKSGETVSQTILLPLSYNYPIVYDSPNIIISYRIKIIIEIPNSFDINFQLPIYLVNEKFPIKQNFV